MKEKRGKLWEDHLFIVLYIVKKKNKKTNPRNGKTQIFIQRTTNYNWNDLKNKEALQISSLNLSIANTID